MPRPSLPRQPPTADADILLDWAEVQRRTTLSRSTVFRLERQGRFPKRVFLSPCRVAWHEHDIERWIAERDQNKGAYVA